MDEHLKRLADVGLELTAAEAALEEGANSTARDALDRAADGLEALRAAWPDLGPTERRVIGGAATPLRTRLDAARARLPRLVALSDVPAAEQLPDPEDDDEPPAAA
jgi:hypothetical protein